MFQASVEGSEASGSKSHFIAARVFVYMVLVVSGVPQASFWSGTGLKLLNQGWPLAEFKEKSGM